MIFWRNKDVLVTGGAGFVGAHLVEVLLSNGAKVTVVDNLSTGSREALRNCVPLIEADIALPCALPHSDVIFNLASPASPVHYQSDPIQTWRSNVLGTANILAHAQNCGARLVQASTSEVYGDPLSHPQQETDWGNVNPIGPRACYDESKRASETLLMDAHRHAGANIAIARIFNTYGPGMDTADGRALPNFIAQAQSQDPLTIHGDGTQTRSFCYVSDTVSGLMLLGSVHEANGEVINIGNPHEVTIRHIAERVNAAFGNQSHIIFEPRPIDDPTRRCPNISKANRILNWSPKVSLDDGLSRMFASVTPVTQSRLA